MKMRFECDENVVKQKFYENDISILLTYFCFILVSNSN
jgi:hypothetical protein